MFPTSDPEFRDTPTNDFALDASLVPNPTRREEKGLVTLGSTLGLDNCGGIRSRQSDSSTSNYCIFEHRIHA